MVEPIGHDTSWRGAAAEGGGQHGEIREGANHARRKCSMTFHTLSVTSRTGCEDILSWGAGAGAGAGESGVSGYTLLLVRTRHRLGGERRSARRARRAAEGRPPTSGLRYLSPKRHAH